jgi:hypothetical protein
LDRAPDFESVGCRFESYRAHHISRKAIPGTTIFQLDIPLKLSSLDQRNTYMKKYTLAAFFLVLSIGRGALSATCQNDKDIHIVEETTTYSASKKAIAVALSGILALEYLKNSSAIDSKTLKEIAPVFFVTASLGSIVYLCGGERLFNWYYNKFFVHRVKKTVSIRENHPQSLLNTRNND